MPDVTITSSEHAPSTDDARIRELMLINLFAALNERDPERRLAAIAANYTEDVIWTDPEVTTHGHAELHERAQQLPDRTHDFVFTAAGPIHVTHDVGHLAFNLGCLNNPPRLAATTPRTCVTDASQCCTHF
jgi:ketosteroid isomerase-like protein